jgi:flagellum-specific peptidoglycan hydrolase FlgJ
MRSSCAATRATTRRSIPAATARAFAQGLARGGYATDPAYADKLARVAAQLKPQSRE